MRIPPLFIRSVLVLLCCALLTISTAAAQAPPVPDLTQGGERSKSHDWNLGPTGARGWMWGWNLETTHARQILVTQVEKGSPADGILEKGDVILGVNGAPFSSDPRKALGAAITEAETTAKGGKLELLRWRKGRTERALLKLRVMGEYSDTSPANCPKSQRIIERACEVLVQQGLGDSIPAEINALSLLATGKPEYTEIVAKLAHSVGPPSLKLAQSESMAAWNWGYANLFLCEYYIATGDKEVIPAIREYSRAIAEGQSEVGTWGHGMVMAEREHTLGGYGALNQAGLGCWLSLILARKCGVNDPAVDRAIDRSYEFFRFYIDKGSIPYGDHAPYYFLHDNNGKNAQAAIGFDWMGNMDGTQFFSRLSTAAYAERELGHTGNYFSFLWGPLGVARAGPEALAAHLREQRWFYDLARRWDGGFTYQGGADADDSYEHWDMTGAFLLTYLLPRRNLRITAGGVNTVNTLKGEEVREVMDWGRDFNAWQIENSYISRKTADLLHSLSSVSPTVRFRAASALALRAEDTVPDLIRLLDSPDILTRYGACQALERMGRRAVPAVDALMKQLLHVDPWLQIRASFALAEIGKPARKAVPEMLRIVLKGTSSDRRETARRYLGIALFLGGYLDTGPRRGLLADSIADVDPDVLVPSIRQLLKTDDGLVRAQIASVYDKLTDEERNQLWPEIVDAVRKPAPSGEMYADEIRLAGLQLMAKHRIREGMQLAVDYARKQNPWGSENRMAEILKELESYGSWAQEMLPQLRELVVYCKDERDFPDDCKKKKTEAVERAIEVISKATDRPTLRHFSELLSPGHSQVQSPAPSTADILLEDFESQDYGAWTATGDAFGRGPAQGTLAGQMPVTGYKGKRLVNSYLGGDASTGTLTSPVFKVERKYLSFLVGGGKDTEKTCMNLLVDGKIVRTATGPNDRPGGSEELSPEFWDVSEWIGKDAILQIVDRATGGWGHINVDHIVLTDRKPQGVRYNAARELQINKKYLLLPVKNGAAKRRLSVEAAGVAALSYEIELADGEPDWWASLDMTAFQQKKATVRVDKIPGDSQALDRMELSDDVRDGATLYQEEWRPQFHFTAARGWLNDPNGLVFDGKQYHLFFQHNPVGTPWGNMTWGHAVSSDLLHWTQRDPAIHPDRLGTIYSGSAVMDWNNTAGFQNGNEPALVCMYTSAGGTSPASAGQPFTQSIAYSTDRGLTWKVYDKNPVLPHVKGENRDPKVFWHSASKSWIAALYLDGNQYALFGSPNLKEWEKRSDVPPLDASECPDFFELQVDGDITNTRWVFWGGNCNYRIGRFDGVQFTNEAGPFRFEFGNNYYAAQSYSDIPAADGRRIQIAWMNGGNYPGMPFNQQMSFPSVLTLRTMPEGIRLCREPVKELESLRGKAHHFTNLSLRADAEPLPGVAGDLFEIRVEIEPGDARELICNIRGTPLIYDVTKKQIQLLGKSTPLESTAGKVKLQILVDRTSIELFARSGTVCMSSCFLPPTSNKTISFSATGGSAKLISVDVWELKSVWGK